MPRAIWPRYPQTIAQMAAWYRQEPCPKCHAPVGAPCADLRSYDKILYGVRTHRERRDLVRALHTTC